MSKGVKGYEYPSMSLPKYYKSCFSKIISREGFRGYKDPSLDLTGPASSCPRFPLLDIPFSCQIMLQQINATPLLHLLFLKYVPFSPSQDAMAPDSLPPPFAQVVWLEEWLSVTFCWWVTFAARAARRRPSKQGGGGLGGG